eukprot:CAMPEP_0204320882 /NCGR_PEP_ID=MMETSP0469-20131031/7868_1 /ASSEMBLY_ACC=CAM_ASM_000384 /TAXON_ID=2969 /ORGANISM="Oxyrrhis marina" /LENGTH=105 /DNA_ID=CAMNT_0051302147 /DNA_START=36 /DNA_END=353 /DNA_ORIENTATION=-
MRLSAVLAVALAVRVEVGPTASLVEVEELEAEDQEGECADRKSCQKRTDKFGRCHPKTLNVCQKSCGVCDESTTAETTPGNQRVHTDLRPGSGNTDFVSAPVVLR